MNGQNRRQHPRSEIDHPARLYYQDIELRDCRIRNFSVGGLYIENSVCDCPTMITTAVPRPGGPDIRTALIEIPAAAEPDGCFTVAVRICFASPVGIGVAFLQSNPALLDYFRGLLSDARAQRESQADTARESPPVRIDPMIEGRIGKACERFLNRHLPEFFSLCSERLPEAADRAASDALRTELFHAQQTLQREAETIGAVQRTQLGERLTQLFEPAVREPGGAGQVSISREMELIAKDEFEEWVAIVGLGHSVESEISGQLHRVELGLS
ncbi:MAG: DUF1631 family protein [Gammaproteobacteria bacterium]|nr:DUF1631 family protein [Gammaproteobacteria bacterium]